MVPVLWRCDASKLGVQKEKQVKQTPDIFGSQPKLPAAIALALLTVSQSTANSTRLRRLSALVGLVIWTSTCLRKLRTSGYTTARETVDGDSSHIDTGGVAWVFWYGNQGMRDVKLLSIIF